MPTIKTKPFQITRIPALNGEWVDIHLSESGNICIESSGYAEIDPKVLSEAIEKVSESE